jgi:hypothetical protein
MWIVDWGKLKKTVVSSSLKGKSEVVPLTGVEPVRQFPVEGF